MINVFDYSYDENLTEIPINREQFIQSLTELENNFDSESDIFKKATLASKLAGFNRVCYENYKQKTVTN